MAITPRKLSLSLTSLPAMHMDKKQKQCPICLEAVAPFVSLSCDHVICVPCGAQADGFGFATCPQCRAPALLDVDKMLEAFEVHREGYSNWRKGHVKGSKGQLSDIRLPMATVVNYSKGLLHLKDCGLLSLHESHSSAEGAATKRMPKALNFTIKPDKPTPSAHLYDALTSKAAAAGSIEKIAFMWWPRSSMWTKFRVLQRTMRALSSTRPGLDFIALPELPEARASFQMWCDNYGLLEWQAVWFDPLLSMEEGGMLGSEIETADRSAQTLQAVLKDVKVRTAASLGARVHMYHSHPNAAVRDEILASGLDFLGDVDEHPTIGSLREAKGWLHGDYSSSSLRPSLADALRNGDISCGSVRVPRGYVCKSIDEQHAAFKELKADDPSIRIVLKPTDGLGCAGLVLDATEADLAPVNTKSFIKGELYTIEEMIGAKGGPSPTVYMCGSTPIAIADQVMEGASNVGNFIPSTAPSKMQQAMVEAGKAIGDYLGLRGQWGLDFVVDEATQNPVIVDLNMGRPNGNLSYFLWHSRQTPPPALASHELFQTVLERVGPMGETAGEFVQLLRNAGLLWHAGCAEGVLPAMHISGMSSSIVVASWKSRNALQSLCKRLKEMDPSAVYKVDA